MSKSFFILLVCCMLCLAGGGDIGVDAFVSSDYDVFLSPLEDFKRAVEEAGLAGKVVYLERGDGYRFRVEE